MTSKQKSESFDCADIERLAQKYIDGKLNKDENRLFEAHLEYCLPCDKKIEFELKLKDIIKEKGKEKLLNSHLEERLHKILRDLH